MYFETTWTLPLQEDYSVKILSSSDHKALQYLYRFGIYTVSTLQYLYLISYSTRGYCILYRFRHDSTVWSVSCTVFDTTVLVPFSTRQYMYRLHRSHFKHFRERSNIIRCFFFSNFRPPPLIWRYSDFFAPLPHM